MTITTAIIENTNANCNYIATCSTTLGQITSFVAISGCVLDHVINTDSLTPSEKLYYLVNDFYGQCLKSWNSQNSKKNSTQSYSSSEIKFSEVKFFEVKFSASKIGSLLGFSRSKIFNIQQKLESLDYLQINRSLNQYGMNNVNVAKTTLPKNIFSHLMLTAKR